MVGPQESGVAAAGRRGGEVRRVEPRPGRHEQKYMFVRARTVSGSCCRQLKCELARGGPADPDRASAARPLRRAPRGGPRVCRDQAAARPASRWGPSRLTGGEVCDRRWQRYYAGLTWFSEEVISVLGRYWYSAFNILWFRWGAELPRVRSLSRAFSGDRHKAHRGEVHGRGVALFAVRKEVCRLGRTCWQVGYI